MLSSSLFHHCAESLRLLPFNQYFNFATKQFMESPQAATLGWWFNSAILKSHSAGTLSRGSALFSLLVLTSLKSCRLKTTYIFGRHVQWSPITNYDRGRGPMGVAYHHDRHHVTRWFLTVSPHGSKENTHIIKNLDIFFVYVALIIKIPINSCTQ